jgi:hypothetical protein
MHKESMYLVSVGWADYTVHAHSTQHMAES